MQSQDLRLVVVLEIQRWDLAEPLHGHWEWLREPLVMRPALLTRRTPLVQELSRSELVMAV